MSRRGAVIEEVEDEEFDDNTDLPLPPLPNTGVQGPLLQQLDDSVVQPPIQKRPIPQPASPPQWQGTGEASASGDTITVDPVTGRKTVWVQDGSAYKMWTSLYPIYFDAKRAYGGSERRIAREKCVWWPLSSDIVDACSQLGFRTLHEPSKRHPKDWENPGRVKVSFKIDGRLQSLTIKTKKQLLEAIGRKMQLAHPDLVPSAEHRDTTPQHADPNAKPSNKKEKAKPGNHVRTPPTPKRRMKARLPQPPPGLQRLSQLSPAQEANILIETVKAGMNTPAPGESAPGSAAVAGKGKRKVVRVRA